MPTLTLTCLAVLLISLSSPCLALTIGVPSEEPTIQAGMNLANPGDTVLVAPGVYAGDGNRDLDFVGKDIVLRSEAGPELTIIDCAGSAPHRGLIFVSGETRACVVDGFTVQNGYVEGHYGAGMYCQSSSPTIVDCAFRNNFAGFESGSSGGAAYISRSSPAFSDCRFEDNAALGSGGAAHCGASDVTFERCRFVGNRSHDDIFSGGAVSCGGGTTFLLDCAFIDNRAAVGGAVSIDASGLYPASVTFERCVFADNVARTYSGGGVHMFSDGAGSLFVRECSFFRNQATTYGGGAISCVGNISLSLTGVTMAGNSGNPGSGISLRSYGGFAVEAIFDRVIIAFGERGPAVHCDLGGTLPAVSCSDIHGNEGGDWIQCLAGFAGVDGNFSADPLFCGLGTGDLTLDAHSPCLPGQHPGGIACGPIGTFDWGCGEPSAVEPSTWGRVKTRFHNK